MTRDEWRERDRRGRVAAGLDPDHVRDVAVLDDVAATIDDDPAAEVAA